MNTKGSVILPNTGFIDTGSIVLKAYKKYYLTNRKGVFKYVFLQCFAYRGATERGAKGSYFGQGHVSK